MHIKFQQSRHKFHVNEPVVVVRGNLEVSSFSSPIETERNLGWQVCPKVPSSLSNQESIHPVHEFQRHCLIGSDRSLTLFVIIWSEMIPDTMWEPISAPFSITHTDKSVPFSSDNCFKRIAADKLAGPPPTWQHLWAWMQQKGYKYSYK